MKDTLVSVSFPECYDVPFNWMKMLENGSD